MTALEHTNIKKYHDKISEIGKQILVIICQDNNKELLELKTLTERQLLLILSIQENNIFIDKDIIKLEHKKKRGGKLHTKHFGKVFFS